MGKKIRNCIVATFVSVFFVSYSQASDFDDFFIPKVKVFNQNMYLGANLTPLFTPGLSPDEIQYLAQQITAEIINSNYPARAAAAAKMIKKSGADVICIQEAWIFELYDDEGNEIITWNFKELLLDALGHGYQEVVTNNHLYYVELFGVYLEDQDVMIAKKHVKIGDTKTLPFERQLKITIPDSIIQPQTIYRGLSIAELEIRKRRYTIANTHLEAFDYLDPGVRKTQAEQVVDVLSDEMNPILLFGDINDTPGSSGDAYEVITGEFDDAWPVRFLGRKDSGLTFGREDLVADDQVFEKTLDYGFVRNDDFITLLGLTVGKTEFSKTESVPYPYPIFQPSPPTSFAKLWPSDHLGLFLIFLFPQ